MSNQLHGGSGVSYSSMAIQMGIIIAAGAYGGLKLDEWLHLSPLFVIVCSLLSIALAMYLMISKLTKKNNDKKI